MQNYHLKRILNLTGLLAIPILLSISCSRKETGWNDSGEAIAFKVTSGAASTRAELVDNANLAGFGDGMGVFAAAYEGTWDGTQPVDYFCNALFAPGGDCWVSRMGSYYWPGKGKAIRFFAYAPYNGEGITLPGGDTKGIPALGYVNPVNLADQQELLVAATDEVDGSPKVIVQDINFKHALSAIRFRCDKEMINGTIDEIRISGLKGQGTVTMDSTPAWTLDGEDCTYSTQTAATPAGEEKMPFVHKQGEATSLFGTDGEYIFLVIPQEVTADTKIHVSFTPENGHKTEYVKGFPGEIAAGTLNTIVLNITKSMIAFTVTVEDLAEGKVIDVS